MIHPSNRRERLELKKKYEETVQEKRNSSQKGAPAVRKAKRVKEEAVDSELRSPDYQLING